MANRADGKKKKRGVPMGASAGRPQERQWVLHGRQWAWDAVYVHGV